MKKIILISFVALMFSIALAEPSVLVKAPKEVEIGNFSVIININPDSADKFDIAEFVPKNWQISSWKINPSVDVNFDSYLQDFKGESYNMNHWKLNSVADKMTLKYEIYARNVGEYNFVTLWVYPGGFNLLTNKIIVVEPTHSSSKNDGVTGYVINPINAIPDKKAQQVLGNNTVAVSFVKVKDLLFSIPY